MIMENYNTILRGLYKELTPREINHISLVINHKLRNIIEDLRNVELYNHPFINCSSDQKLTSVTVFNREVHLRLTFK